MLIFGYNPAWCYEGKDAYLHGNVKLGYLPHWLILSIAYEFIFNKLIKLCLK